MARNNGRNIKKNRIPLASIVLTASILVVVTVFLYSFLHSRLDPQMVQQNGGQASVGQSPAVQLQDESSYTVYLPVIQGDQETVPQWNTISNARLGFSLDYPSEWIVNEQSVEGAIVGRLKFHPNTADEVTSGDTMNGIMPTAAVVTVTDASSAEVLESLQEYDLIEHESESIEIDGYDGYKITGKSLGAKPDGTSGPEDAIVIVIPKQDQTLVFWFMPNPLLMASGLSAAGAHDDGISNEVATMIESIAIY